MSARPSRKRRRSQAFPEAEELQDVVVDDEDEDAPKYVESTGQDRLDKEREVWDAFKDEHVEVFDLSSSLWRRFDLVRELDQQDAQNTTNLLNSFIKYVQLRRDLAQPPPAAEPERQTLEDPPSAQDSPQVPSEGSPAPPRPPTNGASSPSPLKHTPAAPLQPPSEARSREMLAIIAQFSEASIRDREEKVNLTRAACESVERSIRLIDQAIQEQEHAISLGARSGTRLAPILLPEIVMPKWTKPLRVTMSPDLDDVAEDKPPAQSRRKKGRKSRKKETLPAVPLPRPKPPIIPNADPNESRYCYCDQVSFGEMIGCDDPRCEREWFHLTCTNLAAAPEGRKKWYCDDCTLRKNRKRIR
ncbi:hypothetical protein B0H17DRAFT_1044442 [Mycena rosella]|uniref:Chromatin modification-related protein n=1 Tax=Mycena rosella TaxID=1033263 RepID=A0AAD7GRA3_MYCRO|nr:hypothetical protein B0H17DRAFT_1044442 [Mycena rosella]